MEIVFFRDGERRTFQTDQVRRGIAGLRKQQHFSVHAAASQQDGSLRFQTENDAVVRKYFTLLQKTFNIDTEIAIRESSLLKKGNVYHIEITDPLQVQNVLQGTKLSVNEADRGTLFPENGLITQQNCCKRAFIRGAFLASGSISDPEKGYHFEIVCQDES